jgi:hypothetical protein
MIRAAGVAIIALVILAAGLWVQLSTARADLAEASAALAGEREAARFRLRLGAAAQEAVTLDYQLQQGSGADAPLSDYLRGAAGRVWK